MLDWVGFGLVLCSNVWFGLVWFGLVGFGLVGFGLVWLDLVLLGYGLQDTLVAKLDNLVTFF